MCVCVCVCMCVCMCMCVLLDFFTDLITERNIDEALEMFNELEKEGYIL